MFMLPSPLSKTSSSSAGGFTTSPSPGGASSSTASGTPTRGVLPVPVFAMPEVRKEAHGGAADDGVQAVMEDEEEQQDQRHQQRQSRGPTSPTENCTDGLFRSGSTQLGELELRLQSPLHTPGREGRGSSGKARRSLHRRDRRPPPPDNAAEAMSQQRGRRDQPGPEESIADMAEVETEEEEESVAEYLSPPPLPAGSGMRRQTRSGGNTRADGDVETAESRLLEAKVRFCLAWTIGVNGG